MNNDRGGEERKGLREQKLLQMGFKMGWDETGRYSQASPDGAGRREVSSCINAGVEAVGRRRAVARRGAEGDKIPEVSWTEVIVGQPMSLISSWFLK